MSRNRHPCIKFLPVSSLPRVCELNLLKGSFVFEENFTPGWIKYDSSKVTVISSNYLFEPLYSVAPIFDTKKQVFNVDKVEDVNILEQMLNKTLIMCVTRRQQCMNETPERDVEMKFKGVLTNIGFDIDFVMLFPPSAIRHYISEILALIRSNILKRKKFCVKVDFTKTLNELILTENSRVTSDEFVSWHNCSFWITNYCKPRHTLMYVNSTIFWTQMFPYSFFVALPYRLVRKTQCKDYVRELRVQLMFDAKPDENLLVCLWSTENNSPGDHNTFASAFSLGITTANCLILLIQHESLSFLYKFDDGNKQKV